MDPPIYSSTDKGYTCFESTLEFDILHLEEVTIESKSIIKVKENKAVNQMAPELKVQDKSMKAENEERRIYLLQDRRDVIVPVQW